MKWRRGRVQNTTWSLNRCGSGTSFEVGCRSVAGILLVGGYTWRGSGSGRGGDVADSPGDFTECSKFRGLTHAAYVDRIFGGVRLFTGVVAVGICFTDRPTKLVYSGLCTAQNDGVCLNVHNDVRYVLRYLAARRIELVRATQLALVSRGGLHPLYEWGLP